MTWASHIIVGSSIAKVFGLNYILVTFGAVLPDLAEMVIPKNIQHRGITHSASLWIAALAISFVLDFTPLRDVLIGVCFGHLLMDSLTIMGIPILDENSRRLTIFGGRLRTASPREFVLAGIVAFIAFVVIGTSQIDTSGRGWKGMYNQGVIDKREYYENRFRVI